MSYVFHENVRDLKKMICQINHVKEEEIDVSSFIVDRDQDVLREFREKLLSYSDKKFFIVGDYDCDGICATLIMKRLLDDLHIPCNYYIPSRLKEGYGINDRIVVRAHEYGFDVLLCLDNGIAAQSQMKLAKQLGLKTMVIDHHEFSEDPGADAWLHPSLFQEGYGDMCAAGLCCLLADSIRQDDLTTVYGGLGTLADMVQVLGYNRWLMKEMLTILKRRTVHPLRSLSGTDEFDYETLSFQVIPKINAVSRLDRLMNVNYVVRFLNDDSPDCVKYLANILNINEARKKMSAAMYEEALKLMDEGEDIVVVASPDFEEGLCSLTANRLMFRLGKPVIVLNESDGLYKGSGRSPKGTDLYSLLEEKKDLFESFGGHAQAIGLSFRKEVLPELKEYLKGSKIEMNAPDRDVICFRQQEISRGLLEELKKLEPFGTGFERPLLGIRDCTYEKKRLLSNSYPKFVLNGTLSAISFDRNDYDRQFTMMIGSLKADRYLKNRLSFEIEDLI